MIKVKAELDRIRIKSGLNITELAIKAEISPQGMSAILRGTYNPSPRAAKKICEQLGVEFEDVFEIEG